MVACAVGALSAAEELFDRWDKDPELRKEYDALEGELALARLFIEAGTRADLT